MNLTVTFLNCFATLVVLTAFSALGITGQVKSGITEKFTNVQEVYAACGGTDYDEKRGVAVLVNRLSESAIEVFIAAGSTKTWESIEGFGKLEFFVQPLRVVGKSSSGDVYFETGQSATLASTAIILGDDEKEILVTPKITMPIPNEASAVRVKINGLFGPGNVTALTANIDKGNTAKTCYVQKYPPKK